MSQPAFKDDELRASGLYLAYLIDCALHDKTPAEPPVSVSWLCVHTLAAFNSVEAASWRAARTWQHAMPADLAQRWGGQADMTLYRLLHFDVEREAVLSELAARGLSYLPLKGVLVARYYPHPEMRSMADNDILYGFVEEASEGGFHVQGGTEAERLAKVREATEVVSDIMVARGYRAEALHKGNHDTFLREPFYNFELHRALMSPTSEQYAYYKNPWQHAIRDEHDLFGFHFSDEDEYVYHLAHAFKHYDTSGCGIRFLMDMHVLLQRKAVAMDSAYLAAQLRETGLLKFEKSMRSLADALFGGSSDGVGSGLSLDQKNQLSYLLGCGTYGTASVRLSRRMEKLVAEGERDVLTAKRTYMRERLLMREEERREVYPVLSRYRVLFPAFVLARLGKMVFRSPRKVLRELRELRELRNLGE